VLRERGAKMQTVAEDIVILHNKEKEREVWELYLRRNIR
jgi:hypothetical protein